MVFLRCQLLGIAAAFFTLLSLHGKEASLNIYPSGKLELRGPDARRQILVTQGQEADLTRSAEISIDPPGVVQLDKAGMLKPIGNGKATLTVKKGAESTSLEVSVSSFDKADPINFANQIVPIFTKTGCNGGGCHGKSGGQNGFRLSLLGFEPSEDYEYLVKEARGRRIFPAAPERSLLLTKATAAIAHGGGKRLDPESDDYRLLVRWISQGMPYGSTNDPTVETIEVFPVVRTMSPQSEQQLSVIARYSNGAIEDVTRSALYEPNDKDMAKVDETGLVKLFQQPGDVAIMVRYQAKVAVFRATIPLGAEVASFPPTNNYIDKIVFGKLKQIGMPPSEVANDSTFIRRATLDIAGRLPTVAESQAFLGSTNSNKRNQLVDQLLQSSDYADYFANKWVALLRNRRNDAKQMRLTYPFHAWVRDSLFENKPFDQFVRELFTATGEVDHNPAVAWFRQARETTVQLEDTAQVFLGQRLKCAECHHHPYERWSQEDYYRFSAFFSQVSRKSGSYPGDEAVVLRRTAPVATNKKTKKGVTPAGLGSAPLNLSPDQDARGALVDWMTTPDNRYFARSLVNRYWKHFFNRALVEPEDDMRETNPATNPELLDALANSFIKSGYDLKKLVHDICTSTTYQLSSIPNEHNKVDKQNYSRYYPRRLTAEVLLDSVNSVLQSETSFANMPAGVRAVQLPDNSFNANNYFLTVFGRPEMSSACECERSQDASLAQSLHLLNAKDIQEKLAKKEGRAASLANDKRPDQEKLSELYLQAYSRQPNQDELMVALSHLKKTAEKEEDKSTAARKAYEDLLWAFINTKEFLFNH